MCTLSRLSCLHFTQRRDALTSIEGHSGRESLDLGRQTHIFRQVLWLSCLAVGVVLSGDASEGCATTCTAGKSNEWEVQRRNCSTTAQPCGEARMMKHCHLSTSVRGECDNCRCLPTVLHMPERIHGWYCERCCPVCAARNSERTRATEDTYKNAPATRGAKDQLA
jgi:hypothetical protein